MTSENAGPCKIEKGRIVGCLGMRRVLELPGHKGIVLGNLFNMETHALTSMITVHSGEYSKKGLVANFCPFCGENISWHLTREASILFRDFSGVLK